MVQPTAFISSKTTRRCPPIDFEAPGPSRYGDTDRLSRDFAAAGFSITQIEEQEIDVIEVATGAELAAWCRALGLAQYLDNLPEAAQRAWEADLIRETTPALKGDPIRLGGVTRIVVATPIE